MINWNLTKKEMEGIVKRINLASLELQKMGKWQYIDKKVLKRGEDIVIWKRI